MHVANDAPLLTGGLKSLMASTLLHELFLVWNASGTATSAPEKDCANYAHCCWHNLILPHSSQPYPLARYVTHWTLVLELLYLWLAVYSTYMDMAIYDTKVPDGVGKATPWFISVTSASGAGRLALCRPVVLGLRVRAGGWLGGRFCRCARRQLCRHAGRPPPRAQPPLPLARPHSAPGARFAVAVGSGQSQTVAVGAAQRQPVAVPVYKDAFLRLCSTYFCS